MAPRRTERQENIPKTKRTVEGDVTVQLSTSFLQKEQLLIFSRKNVADYKLIHDIVYEWTSICTELQLKSLGRD